MGGGVKGTGQESRGGQDRERLLDDGRTSTIFRILFSVGPSEILGARARGKLHWMDWPCTRSTKKEAAVDVLPLLHYPS